jgi:Protein of unknown function (DUF2961)
LPRTRYLFALVVLFALPASSAGSEAGADTRTGPVGWDVYRRLDRLPMLRTEERTRQFSSYDRSGQNDDGFFGTYSCLRRVPEGCVIAERDGPGQVESIWFTRDLGNVAATGRLRVELDGRTVLHAPLSDVVQGVLGPPFVFPLVANNGQSSGGAYVKVPMPFRHSMRITTGNNPAFYHVTYRAFGSSRGVPRFDPSHPASDVLSNLSTAGEADPKPRALRRTRVRRILRVPAGGRTVLAQVRGSGLVTAMRLRLRGLGSATPRAVPGVLRRARLQMTFDGRQTVDAPLGEFFGSGLGAADVRSLMLGMSARPGGWLTSWWPMPHARSAAVVLANPSRLTIGPVEIALTDARSPRWRRALARGEAGYFRATSRGPAETLRGRDWIFLHARGRGTFVGVTQTMRGGKPEYHLEGDERAYVDGRKRPQLHGTGTEDFYEGGWYFTQFAVSSPFSLPLTGFPKELDAASGCPLPSCKTAYRLMLGDAVSFRSSLRFGIEHGPDNEVDAVYSSTAYWYGSPRR